MTLSQIHVDPKVRKTAILNNSYAEKFVCAAIVFDWYTHFLTITLLYVETSGCDEITF